MAVVATGAAVVGLELVAVGVAEALAVEEIDAVFCACKESKRFFSKAIKA